jgi:zinc transport system permease protein
MLELLSLTFFRNAFLMCVLLSILYGILSFFTVMRKMSFLGAGIAHTAFGGVALGILLGVNPFFTSLIFCVLAALLIGKLARYGNITFDTSIGIFFAFSMALGAFFIAIKKAYTFDLSGYLFGNILGVTLFDTIAVLIALGLFIPFILLFLHRILFMTFDAEVAVVSGVNTSLLDTLLLVFLAAIIVTSIKIVGIILISALVVLPASFGLLLSKNFRIVILAGILYAMIIMVGGLFLSYGLSTPPGATMVIGGTLIYFIALALKRAA